MSKIIVLLSSFFCASAFSQMPPSTPQCVGDDSIGYFDITEADRAFYLQDTIITPDHLLVSGDAQYVNIIHEVKKSPRVSMIKRQGGAADARVMKNYVISESANRISTIFSVDGSDAMLTEWSVKKDGAKVCIPRDFLNSTFNGQRGVLTLVTAVPKTTACLWKFGWASENNTVSNEFYLADVCQNGRGKIGKSMFFDVLNRVMNAR